MSEPSAVAEKLASAFASVSSRGFASARFAALRAVVEARSLDFSSLGDATYNVPFSLRELRSTLQTCRDTAPGPDDVPYFMLLYLGSGGQSFLLDLFNRLWAEG